MKIVEIFFLNTKKLLPLFFLLSLLSPSWAVDTEEGIPQVVLSQESQEKRFQKNRCIYSNDLSIIHTSFDAKLQKKVVIKYLKPPARSFNNELSVFRATVPLSRSLKLFETLYEDNKAFFIIERAERDLYEYIRKAPPKERLRNMRKFFYQVMEALAQLHREDIAHVDVKMQNLFLTRDSLGQEQVKIGDFGCSILMHEKRTCVLDYGTLRSMAPEVYETRKLAKSIKNLMRLYAEAGAEAPEPPRIPEINPFKADIYSAGIVLYYLIARNFPYYRPSRSDQNYAHMFIYGIKGLAKKLNHFDQFDERSLNLLERMMNLNPNERPDAFEVLQDSWFLPTEEISD